MNHTVKSRLSILFWIGTIMVLQVIVAFLTTLDYQMAIFLVAGLVSVTIAFFKLEWTAPILVFSLFLMGTSIGGFLGGAIRFYHVLTILLVIRWIYHVLVTKQERFLVLYPTTIPILLFLGWATFSILWSPNFDDALYRWINVALSVTGAIIFVNICQSKSVQHQVIWYWVFSGIIGGAISYYSGSSMDRVTFMGHMNVISAMMNLCMFFSLGMVILTRRSLFRWFSILTAIVTLIINSTTGSRGGFMGLMAGIIAFVIMGLFNSRIGRKFPVIFSIVFLVSVVLLGLAISQMESLEILGFGRSFDILDPMATDTFAWRIESIGMAINIMHEHVAWIWGMGVGAWEYLQDIYMEYSYGKSIHNIYVNTFFQYGLIGIIFLSWLSVNVVKQIVQAYRWFPDRRTRWFLNCLVAAYISVAVHGLVDLEESKAYMWFPLAATIVFLDYLKEQHERGLPANSKI